jgi:two-component system, response regulator
MHKKTILLIEDSPDDVKLTKRAFKKSEYSEKINLDVVTGGVEALEYFNEKNISDGGKPYLILLDLNLPKINGFQVLKKIRNDEDLKFIPVIVLTSSSEKKDLIKSYKLGANGYIQKPVDFQDFIDVIQKIGEYWIKINRHPHSAS